MNDKLNIRKDYSTAFMEAVEQGRLSTNEDDDNYISNYMYMCTTDKNGDMFKHRITRQYLPDYHRGG
jgi:hypothetical protein